MAWTINNGKLYFNSVLYTGNSTARSITGVGFAPDFVWLKDRTRVEENCLWDIVRGATKNLISNRTNTESTEAGGLTAFGSDGFSLGSEALTNYNNDAYVSWNWLAAGTAPSNTYVVKVVSDSGNKYRFDDFGTSAVTLEISEGGTFTFDQSDSSNNGHPLRFATQADGANSSQYTTGVTTNGTPGQAGAYTRITVAASAPTLFYYCTSHSGMGGQANTPVTNSFSNFAGTIQSNISPNTTAGFSIVSYTGNGGSTPKTVGHGLGVAPKMIIIKPRNLAYDWMIYNENVGATKGMCLNTTQAPFTSSNFNDTAPTTSVFSVKNNATNETNGTYIAYCFAEKQGYSKFSSYVGNANDNGTFVYTGFKPSFVMIKRTDSTASWLMFDNKRANPFNEITADLRADLSNAEDASTSYNNIDFLSNGFKIRKSNADINASGGTYIYMAFAENPFTSSAGTPVTAR